MDTESRHATRLLEALAKSRRQFIELAQVLRSRSDVTRVLESLHCAGYPTQDMIEGYIDVEFDSGKAVAWCLDINWDDAQWTIESHVVLNDNRPRSVQEVVKEFPTRTAETLEKCIEHLQQATSDLVHSVDSIVGLVTT